jgi:hypothetical protein
MVKVMLRRSKKRRRIILVTMLCILVFLLIVMPLTSYLLRPPSQKLILTSADLGPGWQISEPSKAMGDWSGASDAAYIRLAFNDSSSQMTGYSFLSFYPTVELANATYQGLYERLSIDGDVTNVSVGDRAAIFTFSTSDRSGLDRVLVMEIGKAVSEIGLIAHVGPSIDMSLLTELAKIQAAKLP